MTLLMIALAASLLFLALAITAALIRTDYSFDGMTYTLYWGFSKQFILLGDSIYLATIVYGLHVSEHSLSSLFIFLSATGLLVLRISLPLLFDRFLVISNRTILTYLLSGWLMSILPTLLSQDRLMWFAVIATTVCLLLPRRKLPHSYQHETFTELVQLYVKLHADELRYIQRMRISMQKKRALKAILITESMNRPRAYRAAEQLLSHIGITKTIGLMQMQNKYETVHDQIDAASTFLDNAKEPTLDGYTRHYNGSEYAEFCHEVDHITQNA